MVKTRENLAHKLPAATLALRKGMSVLPKIDNTRTVANHWGILSHLWMWCLERNIHIQAQYLPGSLSRQIHERSIGLETGSTNVCELHQMLWPDQSVPCKQIWLPTVVYYNWQPDLFTDVFLQDWTTPRGYANPPWNLIPLVLM